MAVCIIVCKALVPQAMVFSNVGHFNSEMQSWVFAILSVMVFRKVTSVLWLCVSTWDPA